MLRYGASGDLLALQSKPGSKNKRPLLHQAAYGGHVRILEILLEKAAAEGQDVTLQVNTPTQQGNLCPLHLAASSGSLEAVKLLLSRGADINAGMLKVYPCYMLILKAFRGKNSALLCCGKQKNRTC